MTANSSTNMWTEFLTLLRKDDLLTQSLKESCDMLDTDWAMYEASVKSLRQSDTAEIEFDIEARDRSVDAGLEDVRRKVLTHLSISGKGDLSAGLVLVSVVIDIEKIGDYTKRIFELARQHPRRLVAGSLEDSLKQAEAAVSALFQQTIQAYKGHDAAVAKKLVEAGSAGVLNACEAVEQALTSGKATDLNSQDAASVALYARYLRRIAASSWTILTSLVNPFHLIGHGQD